MTPNDRLSDDELAVIGDAFPTHLGEPKRSVLVQRLLSEVRAHRAAALSDEERAALKWLAGELRHYRGAPNVAGRARDALERLTGGAP